jgi:hypothetical protein
MNKEFAQMKAVTKTEPKIEDFFQGSKARRSFFKGEELVAYDCGQLLQMERGFASVGLGPPDGKPQVSVLLAVWKRARESWKRVTEALPAGELKDEMRLELQIREATMDRLCDQAEALVERNGHA